AGRRLPARGPGRVNAPAPARGRSPVSPWFDHHAYSLVASLGRMLRRPWSTLLTVGVMAIALALPLGLLASLANIERFAGDVQQAREVSVFLGTEVEVTRARELADELRARPDVASVELREPEQGLAELDRKSTRLNSSH